MPAIRVGFADQGDLAFASQDHLIPGDVVARKIEARQVLVVELDDRPVGYLRLEFLWSLVPYISLITVAADCRRQGVGKALLAFAWWLSPKTVTPGCTVLPRPTSRNRRPGTATWCFGIAA